MERYIDPTVGGTTDWVNEQLRRGASRESSAGLVPAGSMPSAQRSREDGIWQAIREKEAEDYRCRQEVFEREQEAARRCSQSAAQRQPTTASAPAPAPAPTKAVHDFRRTWRFSRWVCRDCGLQTSNWVYANGPRCRV